MVARDLSNSASTRLSCSILAMIRSMSLPLPVDAKVNEPLAVPADASFDSDVADTTGCDMLLPRL